MAGTIQNTINRLLKAETNGRPNRPVIRAKKQTRFMFQKSFVSFAEMPQHSGILVPGSSEELSPVHCKHLIHFKPSNSLLGI